MDLEKKLKSCQESKKVIPDERNIKETVEKSIEVYCQAEQERLLTYGEFLWTQLRLMRKRWWVLQMLLLILLWTLLPLAQSGMIIQKVFGVVASLFIILIVPELWKSQTYQSMEIEAVSYYSLRRIYAARMLLFGIVDIALITLFCGLAAGTMHIMLSQLLIQFIFPMVVTTIICFANLCSRYSFGEAAAIMMCIVWSTLWMIVVLNEKIYTAITFPLWSIFIGIAFLLLTYMIYRTLHNCDNYWEVNLNGTGIG